MEEMKTHLTDGFREKVTAVAELLRGGQEVVLVPETNLTLVLVGSAEYVAREEKKGVILSVEEFENRQYAVCSS